MVQAGDTLLGLAQRFNLSWQNLVAVNAMNSPYFIYPGEVLRLPPGAWEAVTVIPTSIPTSAATATLPTPTPTATAAAPTATPNLSPTSTIQATYVVQSGDYLTALAQRLGVDWRTLVEINNIPSPYTIYPGEVLKLP